MLLLGVLAVGLIAVVLIALFRGSKPTNLIPPQLEERLKSQPVQLAPQPPPTQSSCQEEPKWLIEWRKQFEGSLPTGIRGVSAEDGGVSLSELTKKYNIGDQLYIATDVGAGAENALLFVHSNKKDMLGHLSVELAARFFPMLSAGGHAEAIITKVNGGTPDEPTLGVSVMLGYISPGRMVKNDSPALVPRVSEDIPDVGLYAWESQWKKCLHSSIRGVSFNNDDGISRQQIIQKCSVGELLTLVRDPDNPHSVNGTAIKLIRETGEMLGHVASEISEILADQIDRGALAEARIIKITGGTTKAQTLGVNIIIGQNYAPRRMKAKAAKVGA